MSPRPAPPPRPEPAPQRAAAPSLTDALAPRLSALGLSASAYLALATLWEWDGASVRTLARRMGVPEAEAWRRVSALVRAGYADVDAFVSEADVWLTERGADAREGPPPVAARLLSHVLRTKRGAGL